MTSQTIESGHSLCHFDRPPCHRCCRYSVQLSCPYRLNWLLCLCSGSILLLNLFTVRSTGSIILFYPTIPTDLFRFTVSTDRYSYRRQPTVLLLLLLLLLFRPAVLLLLFDRSVPLFQLFAATVLTDCYWPTATDRLLLTVCYWLSYYRGFYC